MMTEPDQNYVSQSPETDEEDYILEVNNLKKFFPIKGGIWKRIIGQVYAVNGVSFKIKKGETIGVVGESGCGKTTLGRTILDLIPITEGDIIFKGKNIVAINKTRKERIKRIKKLVSGFLILIIGLSLLLYGISTIALQGEDVFNFTGFLSLSLDSQLIIILFPIIGAYLIYKGAAKLSALSPLQLMLRRQMQIVFQDPYASLNPRMTVRGTLSEPLKVHKIIPDNQIENHLINILETVGLGEMHLDRFAHEFSGGQRQRIVIARALVLQPEFLILDEPTASTDVSVQAKILNLLKDLQIKMGLTYVFISHDLSVIKHMSDRIIVMYLGKMVEVGSKRMFSNPEKIHPYTTALFSAVPIADPTLERKKIIITGDVPSSSNPPSGCVFHTRCQYALANTELMKVCQGEEPELLDVDKGHQIACHLYNEKYSHFKKSIKNNLDI